MCLHSGFYKVGNKSSVGIGYKVYNKRMIYGKLTSEIRGKRLPLPINRWMNAHDYQQYAPPSEGVGFHVFLSEADAEYWQDDTCEIVQKIKYRKVTAIGIMLNGRANIVAEEVLILP